MVKEYIKNNINNNILENILSDLISQKLFLMEIKSLNINNILSIFFIQIIILNLFFTKGIIGNPNNEIKNFIYQPDIKKIIKNIFCDFIKK